MLITEGYVEGVFSKQEYLEQYNHVYVRLIHLKISLT